jgi:hypothetical protein
MKILYYISNIEIESILSTYILHFVQDDRYNSFMLAVSGLFFLASLYYLYFFAALGKTGAFFGFAYLFLASLLIWVSSIKVPDDKKWFVIKSFGYGWTPITWQAWTVLLVSVILLIIGAMIDISQSHSGSDFLINYIPFLGIIVAVLIAICYKTGEAPKWRWGKSN